MLRTTDKSTGNGSQSTLTNASKKNQGAPSSVDSGSVDENIKNLSSGVKSAQSKKPIFAKANSGTDFITPGAKEAFIHLRKAFTETTILRHFDPECHIQIETDALEYTIGGVLSQMTSDQHSSGHVTYKDLILSKSEIGQWHPVAFFFQKMTPAENRYETYNQGLLAIVEAFKT